MIFFFREYSRNETTLKIGHLANVIPCVKWSVWVKNNQFQKTCQKPFYKNIGAVLYKKSERKNNEFLSIKAILKISHYAKAVASTWAQAEATTFAKWLVFVKNWKCQKHAKHHSTRKLKLFSAKKKRSKKHQIFEKWDNFENRPPRKGNSLCKMVKKKHSKKHQIFGERDNS